MAKKNTTETILDDLSSYLSNALENGIITLSNRSADGRSNSSEDERKISQALSLHFISDKSYQRRGITVTIAPPRCWYDFLVASADQKIWLPVNVKVTAMRGQDNIASKEGLFYALTGVRPKTNGVALNNWENYCKAISTHLNPYTDADYYFLVVSKVHIGHVFWTSLKQIRRVVANGNNPPFQCAWKDNQTRAKRPQVEAVKHLLDVLGDTFRLRAEADKLYRKLVVPKRAELDSQFCKAKSSVVQDT